MKKWLSNSIKGRNKDWQARLPEMCEPGKLKPAQMSIHKAVLNEWLHRPAADSAATEAGEGVCAEERLPRLSMHWKHTAVCPVSWQRWVTQAVQAGHTPATRRALWKEVQQTHQRLLPGRETDFSVCFVSQCKNYFQQLPSASYSVLKVIS